MDLSSTYRSIVKKHFPNAKIVADRFHVIRLLKHQCMMTYRELSSQVKSNRGILALLHTRPDRLTPQRKMKLIQRRAYGFRNFENYRTRVRVLCC